jgi:hypothetical protein
MYHDTPLSCAYGTVLLLPMRVRGKKQSPSVVLIRRYPVPALYTREAAEEENGGRKKHWPGTALEPEALGLHPGRSGLAAEAERDEVTC